MKSENNLLLFVKNPELGKVKTRLAKTIGDQRALAVYYLLLEHTRAVTQPLACNKTVFYSDRITSNDLWEEKDYDKEVQSQGDLGERMSAAFERSILLGYKKHIIIGSDCIALTSAHIERAFSELHNHDIVIGPAKDGGYYLLGMKAFAGDFFKNKKWSSDSVLQETLNDISRLHLSFYLLPVLSDIDEEKDLEGYENILGK